MHGCMQLHREIRVGVDIYRLVYNCRKRQKEIMMIANELEAEAKERGTKGR